MDGIALIDARLDPTLTGKMEQEEIAIVIRMLTKIRPNFRIVDFDAKMLLSFSTYIKLHPSAKRIPVH